MSVLAVMAERRSGVKFMSVVSSAKRAGSRQSHAICSSDEECSQSRLHRVRRINAHSSSDQGRQRTIAKLASHSAQVASVGSRATSSHALGYSAGLAPTATSDGSNANTSVRISFAPIQREQNFRLTGAEERCPAVGSSNVHDGRVARAGRRARGCTRSRRKVSGATPEIHGGNGFDVLDGQARVVSDAGDNWTGAMLRSGLKMKDIADQHGIHLALLMDISAACGSTVIYDGPRRLKVYRGGPGVAVAILVRAGIPVVSQRDERTLGLLFTKLGVATVHLPRV
jgi:uncharacterized protein YbbK (DUF523 family)